MTVFTGGDSLTLSNCKTYYLTDKKKYVRTIDNPSIEGQLHMPYVFEEQRYDGIANYFMHYIIVHGVQAVALEDYAFAAKGKVFHIAENCGRLKHCLRNANLPYVTFSPNVIKQHATGKGNAKKEQMHEAFVKETGINLMDIYQPGKEKCDSPVSDIVDSFWTLKLLYDNIHT